MYRGSDVTVYVPCYRAEETIEPCLSSIIGQSEKPARIVLIDDGSEQSLPAMPVEVVKHPENRGLAAARNTALSLCETPLIASIDSDVVVNSDWLEQLLEAINGSEYAGAGGRMEEGCRDSVADRWRAVHMCQHWGDEDVANPRFLYGANTLFRSDVLREIGGYDVRCRSNDEDRILSDAIYSAGYSLLYTPRARCHHMKSDRDESAVAGYWNWHKTKGILAGEFDTASGLISRIERVNFGIFDYRYNMDLEDGRSELLGMDLLIPWIFCIRDLALFNEQSGTAVPSLSGELTGSVHGAVRKSIERAALSLGSATGPGEWCNEYVSEFRRCLKKYQWEEKFKSCGGMDEQ